MRRRNILNERDARKTIQSHLIFVFLLTFGALIRVANDEDTDGNVIMFAMVLAVGMIFALSICNKFIIDLFNDLNDRWRFLNYCIPAVVVLLLILVLGIPIELVDMIALTVLILTANLAMYALAEKPNGTP